MPLPTPEPGLVIRYAYLWHAEHHQDREEGGKDRPCAVILTARDEAGEIVVSVLPITHTPPRQAADAVEIPLAVKRRLGLDEARSWVVTSEMNRFIWPGPDLRPVPASDAGRYDHGLLPPGLYRAIQGPANGRFRTGWLQGVDQQIAARGGIFRAVAPAG